MVRLCGRGCFVRGPDADRAYRQLWAAKPEKRCRSQDKSTYCNHEGFAVNFITIRLLYTIASCVSWYLWAAKPEKRCRSQDKSTYCNHEGFAVNFITIRLLYTIASCVSWYLGRDTAQLCPLASWTTRPCYQPVGLCRQPNDGDTTRSGPTRTRVVQISGS